MSNVNISKDIRGNWAATTDVKLTDKLMLTMSTSKGYTGMVNTHASVSSCENGMRTHRVYEDFSHRLDSVKYPRVTSKVVEAQHLAHLNNIYELIQKAKQHYNITEELA